MFFANAVEINKQTNQKKKKKKKAYLVHWRGLIGRPHGVGDVLREAEGANTFAEAVDVGIRGQDRGQLEILVLKDEVCKVVRARRVEDDLAGAAARDGKAKGGGGVGERVGGHGRARADGRAREDLLGDFVALCHEVANFDVEAVLGLKLDPDEQRLHVFAVELAALSGGHAQFKVDAERGRLLRRDNVAAARPRVLVKTPGVVAAAVLDRRPAAALGLALGLRNSDVAAVGARGAVHSARLGMSARRH